MPARRAVARGVQPGPAPGAPAPQPRPTRPSPRPPVARARHAGTGSACAAHRGRTAGAPASFGPTAAARSPQGPRGRIKFEKELRQSTNQNLLLLAVQYMAGRCDQEDVLAGNDDPNLPLVACSQDHKYVYVLDKSIISGDQIKNASSGFDQQNAAYVVDVEFRTRPPPPGPTSPPPTSAPRPRSRWTPRWSAPADPGGDSRRAHPDQWGNPPFTAETAKQLANVLKYGSLPLSFESSEAETVSATLGLTSLRAGLIAGAIGLALVLLYSLLYYRLLGVLTALSLVASGAMVFGILVLLGRYINYTLDLAGIAGLIIGIGTTADSFVVFFERIKDEIREGVRSVPRCHAVGRGRARPSCPVTRSPSWPPRCCTSWPSARSRASRSPWA